MNLTNRCPCACTFCLRSLKEFNRYVKNNPKVNMNEWDNYAHNNCLFSAFTLACHKEVYSFKELIRKI